MKDHACETYQTMQHPQRPYGLLGKTLKHSFSPQLHAAIGAALGEPYPYVLFEKQSEELASFLQGDSWAGLNVTIPYKEAVIPYCDALSDEASEIGAVNTIVREGERLIGHNTDYAGFRALLCENGVAVRGANCLVLGSGGASKTVQCVLRDLGAAKVTVVSRSGDVNYTNASQQQDAEILVNTTPIGMYPNNGRAPLYPGSFTQLQWAVDVIYSPLPPISCIRQTKAGMETVGGLGMYSSDRESQQQGGCFWGRRSRRRLREDPKKICFWEKENIVLQRYAGCQQDDGRYGIADRMGREFCDIDQMIVYDDGREIPQIFAEEGKYISASWSKKSSSILPMLQVRSLPAVVAWSRGRKIIMRWRKA